MRQAGDSAADDDDADDLRTVVAALRTELHDTRAHCDRLDAEKVALASRGAPLYDAGMAEELISQRDKMATTEHAYSLLLGENASMRREISALQVEIDEMQDQFREEEAEEFRETQRELEMAAKNCRILQYKLRKAEKRNETAEADRQHFEERLRELEEKSSSTEEEQRAIRELEEELIVAKEVSVRLHDELEASEERRGRTEEDYEQLQRQLADAVQEKQRLQTHVARVSGKEAPKEEDSKEMGEGKTSPASLSATSHIPRHHRSGSPSPAKVPATIKRPQPGELERSASTESESALMRELYETVERETDLKEQMIFAENEAKALRKKLTQLEQENETLSLQVQKMAEQLKTGKPQLRQGLYKKHVPLRGQQEEEELDPTE
ncbi:PREDICTED: protein SOGA3-like, partial [Priapulus caudatus]|uniref:Protein SOGA3-like n=1 Tax=Priapulus caudatus TaxID=37621 RepID=A0ABM1F2T7_PRICU